MMLFSAATYGVLMLCSQQTPSKERIPLPRPRPLIDRVFTPSTVVDEVPVYSDVPQPPPAPPIPKHQDRME